MAQYSIKLLYTALCCSQTVAQYSIKFLYTALCCSQTVAQYIIKLLYTVLSCSHTLAQYSIKLLYTALCCSQTVAQYTMKLLYNVLYCSHTLTVLCNWSPRDVAKNQFYLAYWIFFSFRVNGGNFYSQLVETVSWQKFCARHGPSVHTKSFCAHLDKDQPWCLKTSEKAAEDFSLH